MDCGFYGTAMIKGVNIARPWIADNQFLPGKTVVLKSMVPTKLVIKYLYFLR